MTKTKRLLLSIAAASSLLLVGLLSPLVFAAITSQARSDCFDTLIQRQAPISDFNHYLGQPKHHPDEEAACYHYDLYSGTVRRACIEDDGRVVDGGGIYICGASLPALAKYGYTIAWRAATSPDERRVHGCS